MRLRATPATLADSRPFLRKNFRVVLTIPDSQVLIEGAGKEREQQQQQKQQEEER
jgi:hypothetical protein